MEIQCRRESLAVASMYPKPSNLMCITQHKTLPWQIPLAFALVVVAPRAFHTFSFFRSARCFPFSAAMGSLGRDGENRER